MLASCQIKKLHTQTPIHQVSLSLSLSFNISIATLSGEGDSKLVQTRPNSATKLQLTRLSLFFIIYYLLFILFYFIFFACGIIFCAYGFMFWSLAIFFFQFFVGFDRDLGLDGLFT